MRPMLCALTGCALFAYWALAGPTFEAAAAQSQWPTVIWFSATQVLLAFALEAFGRMAGGRWAVRLGFFAGLSVTGSSVANIFEDGFGLSWFFAPFVLGELLALVSLLVLTIVVAAGRRGTGRLLAVVPAGTALGLILFVPAGGIIMLVTWLAGAVAAARLEVAIPSVGPDERFSE